MTIPPFRNELCSNVALSIGQAIDGNPVGLTVTVQVTTPTFRDELCLRIMKEMEGLNNLKNVQFHTTATQLLNPLQHSDSVKLKFHADSFIVTKIENIFPAFVKKKEIV